MTKKEKFLNDLKEIREKEKEKVDESNLTLAAMFGSYKLKDEAAKKANEDKEEER